MNQSIPTAESVIDWDRYSGLDAALQADNGLIATAKSAENGRRSAAQQLLESISDGFDDSTIFKNVTEAQEFMQSKIRDAANEQGGLPEFQGFSGAFPCKIGRSTKLVMFAYGCSAVAKSNGGEKPLTVLEHKEVYKPIMIGKDGLAVQTDDKKPDVRVQVVSLKAGERYVTSSTNDILVSLHGAFGAHQFQNKALLLPHLQDVVDTLKHNKSVTNEPLDGSVAVTEFSPVPSAGYREQASRLGRQAVSSVVDGALKITQRSPSKKPSEPTPRPTAESELVEITDADVPVYEPAVTSVAGVTEHDASVKPAEAVEPIVVEPIVVAIEQKPVSSVFSLGVEPVLDLNQRDSEPASRYVDLVDKIDMKDRLKAKGTVRAARAAKAGSTEGGNITSLGNLDVVSTSPVPLADGAPSSAAQGNRRNDVTAPYHRALITVDGDGLGVNALTGLGNDADADLRRLTDDELSDASEKALEVYTKLVVRKRTKVIMILSKEYEDAKANYQDLANEEVRRLGDNPENIKQYLLDEAIFVQDGIKKAINARKSGRFNTAWANWNSQKFLHRYTAYKALVVAGAGFVPGVILGSVTAATVTLVAGPVVGGIVGLSVASKVAKGMVGAKIRATGKSLSVGDVQSDKHLNKHIGKNVEQLGHIKLIEKAALIENVALKKLSIELLTDNIELATKNQQQRNLRRMVGSTAIGAVLGTVGAEVGATWIAPHVSGWIADHFGGGSNAGSAPSVGSVSSTVAPSPSATPNVSPSVPVAPSPSATPNTLPVVPSAPPAPGVLAPSTLPSIAVPSEVTIAPGSGIDQMIYDIGQNANPRFSGADAHRAGLALLEKANGNLFDGSSSIATYGNGMINQPGTGHFSAAVQAMIAEQIQRQLLEDTN